MFLNYLYGVTLMTLFPWIFLRKKTSKALWFMRGISQFCDEGMLEQQEMLIFLNKAIMRVTLLLLMLITQPPYLVYPTHHKLHWIAPTPHPSLSGRPPASETLDSAGSALSAKFRKPLATSNHYLKKKGRLREKENERKNKRHTQKQTEREIRFLLFSVTQLH